MLAVVGDHLLGTPTGGFLGVDVFFVISGFLITGLLLRERRRTGRIDLLAFYRRRIKRTVPVAWLVLLVTVPIGALILPVYQVDQLMSGAASAGTFWSNWHLVAVGADYLHATDVPTAVQHYWSLAVEEQFYLLWPLLLLSTLAIGSRLPRARHAPAFTILVVAAVASLLWAAHETQAHPTGAYFSTFTRGWELLVGASLAFAVPVLERLSDRARPAIAWSGLLLIGWGLLRIGPDNAFPYPWALVPVVGTALVIAAGTGDADTQMWPITNSAAQYLGTISYSIYLWHFPVVVFTQVFHASPGRIVHLLELALIVLLSVISYHLVEVPLRVRSWRRPFATWTRPQRRTILTISGAMVACSLLAGAIVVSRQGSEVAAVPVAKFFASTSSGVQAQRTAEIESALSDSHWPALTPNDRQLGESARVPEWTRDGCLNAFGPDETARRCVYGDRDSRRTVVLYGDSVALSYLPALRQALAGRDWRIEVLTSGQCPAIDVSVTQGDGTPYAACDDYHRFALARIAEEHPQILLMTSSYLSLDRLASGSRDVTAGKEWAAATASTVARVAKSVGEVVLLDAPPLEASPQNCKTVVSSPSDCVAGVQSNWLIAADSQHDGAVASGAENVHYPSTLPWFCTSAGLCPPYTSGVVTLADGMHLTDAGARRLAPLMLTALSGVIAGLAE